MTGKQRPHLVGAEDAATIALRRAVRSAIEEGLDARLTADRRPRQRQLRGTPEEVANAVAERVYIQLAATDTLWTMGSRLLDYLAVCEGEVLDWIDAERPADAFFGDERASAIGTIHQAIAEYLFHSTQRYLDRPDVTDRPEPVA